MARMSRALRVRPVTSLKHVVDVATSAVLAVQSSIPVIQAVNSPALANVTQVENGSVVRAIYLRAEVLATNVYAGVPRIYMTVFKDPGNNLIDPPSNSVGPDDNKKHVIHQEMIMLGGNTPSGESAFPRTMFQGVIVIPKHMQRFGYSDELHINFQNGTGETTGIANACIQCIYKDFK